MNRVVPGTVAAAIHKFMATDYFANQIAAATRLSWSATEVSGRAVHASFVAAARGS